MRVILPPAKPKIEKFIKPNVRLMFIPDEGYIIFDADLKQSDAQVVAWEAQDETLKDIFRAGLDLHRQNAIDIYGILHRAPTDHERQMAKHGVHATDFGASPRTMALKLDMTVHQADQFQKRWFFLHPGVKKWQERVETELNATRTIANKFGYRRIFFERVEGLLPEALAWVPQSTTANVIDKGINNIEDNLPEVELMLQGHDSTIGQFKEELYQEILSKIREQMLITVPYDDPLVIGVDMACSHHSWGACKKVPWEPETNHCPH